MNYAALFSAPAIKQGGRASAIYAASGMADTQNQAALAAAYINQLKDQAASVLGATIGASLQPLQYHGDFNWAWTDGIGVNSLSYNYISGAIAPAPNQPGIYRVGQTGSLANLYQQLVTALQWSFSEADRGALQTAQTQSSAQATTLIQTYAATYGVPTQAQITAAQASVPWVQTALDYIVLYQVGYIWAGIKPNSPGLSLQSMQQAESLSNLLPYATPSAQPTIQALVAYLNALGPASRLMDMQSLGNYTIKQLKNNQIPSASNGGILLSNPPSGATYWPGWSSNTTVSQILQDLNNASQQVTLQFSAQKSSSSSYNVAFSGSAGLSWMGDLLNISAGTSFRGDVAQAQGAGSTMNISMVYPGVTVLPLFPAAFQSNSTGTTGWLDEAVIYQAWSNQQAGPNASSGFSFGAGGVPSGIKLGVDGTGYLTALVVSGYPTITVNFTQGDYQQFSSWLSTHTSVSVSLFGFIPLGSTSVDTYTASASQSSSQAGFSLTLTPPAPGSSGQTIPLPNQTVPVLAAQLSWLGATPA